MLFVIRRKVKKNTNIVGVEELSSNETYFETNCFYIQPFPKYINIKVVSSITVISLHPEL